MGRDRWSSRTIFLFAAIGSAVGLGNIWRFPYLTYKFGGGAFLIPYLIALLIIGIPIIILEFAIGQKLQKGAVDAFSRVNKKLRGIGFGAIFASFVIVVYYAAVMAWAMIYFFRSFANKVPWADDASGYFFGNVLQISDGIGQIGGINLPIFIALLAVWVLIFFCVYRGVKSVGKVVTWTVPLPLILLVVLFIRGITLEGSLNGILYYIRPDFTALLSSEIWLTAASQIFFTLSLGAGLMIAYASYNKETQDITKNSYITSITNCSISIFAGFVVFAVLGYMAHATGVGVADVATSGPGLAFVAFPEALSLMPGAWFFAALFFLTLLTLGIDSAFSLVEAVNTVIADRASKLAKHKIAFYVCFAAFLLGILFTTNAGLYFLDVIDHFVSNFGLVLVGIFECLAIGWIYGAERMRQYINSVSDWKIGRWWNYCIKYVVPLVLSVLVVLQFWKEITTPYEGYPGWALALGWIVVVVPIVVAIALAFKPAKVEVEV